MSNNSNNPLNILFTKNCVICGSPDIIISNGHVMMKIWSQGGFWNDVCYSQFPISVMASRCKSHENVEDIKGGYFGEWQSFMGITLEQPKQPEPPKPTHTELVRAEVMKRRANDAENEGVTWRVGFRDVREDSNFDFSDIWEVSSYGKEYKYCLEERKIKKVYLQKHADYEHVYMYYTKPTTDYPLESKIIIKEVIFEDEWQRVL